MAKLTPEQQKALDELTALASAPDTDEDFEIEIYDGTKGARVPYSRGKSWLKETFGFDIGDAPATGEGDQGKTPPGKGKTPPAGKAGAEGGDGGGDTSVAGRYFGGNRGK